MTTTLTARQWVDSASVAADITRRWPNYRLFLIATDDADGRSLTDAAAQLLDEAEAFARAAGDDDVHHHIARWHDAYRDFGIKPRLARASVDALIRRARTERGLPRINSLVDIYNAISVLHHVPIGGEDLDRYDGPPRLVTATGNEDFRTLADGEPLLDHPEPGEPIWVDSSGVTCRRWNWRQTARTAITADTRRVGFIVDSLDAPEHPGAQRAVEQLAG